MQQFGILGGTFNPVHRGHVIMAEAALAQANLDCILWVPAYAPPHRDPTVLLDFNQRLAMVQLAIANHPRFAVSTVEREHRRPSYAVDTLHQLQRDYPHRHWHWIIGFDAFQTLPKWYKHAELVAECDWLIAPRPAPLLVPPFPEPQMYGDLAGGDLADSDLAGGDLADGDSSGRDRCEQVVQHLASEGTPLRWRLLQMPSIDISSSQIRQYCRDRRSIADLVPTAVNTYIISNGLYQPVV
ncbi:MAG TPA: nicotinate (nicotinamide) nucleotide adenylyltransferase [Chroococcidiopsis sp.]